MGRRESRDRDGHGAQARNVAVDSLCLPGAAGDFQRVLLEPDGRSGVRMPFSRLVWHRRGGSCSCTCYRPDNRILSTCYGPVIFLLYFHYRSVYLRSTGWNPTAFSPIGRRWVEFYLSLAIIRGNPPFFGRTTTAYKALAQSVRVTSSPSQSVSPGRSPAASRQGSGSPLNRSLTKTGSPRGSRTFTARQRWKAS